MHDVPDIEHIEHTSEAVHRLVSCPATLDIARNPRVCARAFKIGVGRADFEKFLLSVAANSVTLIA
jgi:hypothetical protein